MLDQMTSAAAAAAQDIDGFSSVGVGREHEFEAGRIAIALNGERELSCGESFKISRGREPTADGEASLLQREERTRGRDMAASEARCFDARLGKQCRVD